MVSTVRRNIIANYIGNGWSALMGLAFIPLYIKYLGMEAYGLMGVFAALQAWLVLLDMGLSQTLNREMARFLGGKHTAQSIRDLLRSIEVVYIFIAIVIAFGGITAAPWLSDNWLKVERMPLEVVAQALAITGGVIALRWLGGLYRSAIMGLQEQVWINVSNMIFATLRGMGAVAVLAWISATIQAFFIYQGLVAALETIVLGAMLQHFLPRSPKRGHFRWQALQQVWRFAGGILGITLLSLLLTQIDKVLLSKLLSLTEFGHYTLASVVSGALYMIISPVSSAAAPRMAELVAKDDSVMIRTYYHRYAQLLTMIIVPTGCLVSGFSDHFLLLWTRNSDTTQAVAPIVSVLIIGTMLNGLMYIPYMLQLAYGWTRFAIVVNSISVAILVPMLYLITNRLGAIGAAWAWLFLNIGYVLIALPFMHRRLLCGELRNWYQRDVLPALFLVSVVVGFGHLIAPIPTIDEPLISVMVLVLAALVALGVAGVTTPVGREMAIKLKKHFLGGEGRC